MKGSVKFTMNFWRDMEIILKDNASKGLKPRLLLHSCCAPCSSSVLEFLSKYFKLTVLYYNPNIYPNEEYLRRAAEQKRFIKNVYGNEIGIIEFLDSDTVFYTAVKGLEAEKEGGARCEKCFVLRLEKAAKLAKACSYDYFCSTLTVSPHKNAKVINEIGFDLQKKHGVNFLPSDFKKKNGFKRSAELSREHDLYKQTYCGCVFSQNNDE